MRRFEIVSAYINEGVNIPVRATSSSAGYDLESIENIVIKPREIVLVKTGLRIKMPANEVVLVYPRSSLAVKKGLMMSNSVGVIDSDYYNAKNEGHVMIPLFNFTDQEVKIEKHERLAQAIFTTYFKTVDEKDSGVVRLGGFGSSDLK